MLGKKGSDYVMDKETQEIIDSHNGDIKAMISTMGALNTEVQYIKESRFLSPEEKELAVQRYKEVINALRKVVNGEESDG